jgi:NTP pyrophosphatase (non-canonical NTP hydrolase)
MKDDEFTKLFKYIQKEFKSVHEEIADVKADVLLYSNNVDAFAKQSETYM